MTLVREFVASRSEQAFATLVDRHIGLVYTAAARQAAEAELAREIAQAVFIILARKAASLGPKTILSAWLYRTTSYVAADAMKSRRRRQAREQEAYMQSTLDQSATDTWAQLAPQLDEAMAELGEADRTALVLRYFENKSAREIAGAMQMEEATAQKRVSRALEKLRGIFQKRGLTLTATVIASAVASNAVAAAPAGLAMSIKTASLAACAGTFTLAKIMTLSNLKLAAGALTIAGMAAALVVQNQAQTKLREDNGVLQEQLAQIQTDNAALANQIRAASNAASLSHEQLNELLKLRGEVGSLQRQAADLETLRAENQRLATLNEHLATAPAPMDPKARQLALSREKISDARDGALGIILFAGDNQGQCPTNFEEMASFFKQGWAGTNDYDFTYSGSMQDIPHPADTIILKEKQAWQTLEGKWAKVYAFADGHSELHVTPDGNFDDWENQRLIPPPAGQ